MEEISLLGRARLQYRPRIPTLLADWNRACFKPIEGKKKADESLRKWFPRTLDQTPYKLEKGNGSKRSPLSIGAVFSGGQAAGGHNVLAGIWDAIRQSDPKSRLIGFLGGPSGIVENKWRELKGEAIDQVRNQGGFDLLGSGRTKIETVEQMEASFKVCQALQLDGLIVIGGDDSNTNAALLAEFFLERGSKTRVVGVPKTIDGDLRSSDIEISFGFDTACKTYSELIGNIARDATSAKKYYHFIKLMGRSASHIALECALATHPNIALIGEEKKTLKEIVRGIADLICRRSEAGKEYGVVLVPEGLVEFIPEIKVLISELNEEIAKGSSPPIEERLSSPQKKTFSQLPDKIQKQLLLERDPHGNIAVSQIETEKLLMDLVKQELKQRGKGKFSAQEHFFGYEGRAAFPSNFDANYSYALGMLAALAVREELTGMICAFQNLKYPSEKWEGKAIPVVQLMHRETRSGQEKPVVQKTIVDMKGNAFVYYSRFRKIWELDDRYSYPGPMQFFGDREMTDSIPISLTV